MNVHKEVKQYVPVVDGELKLQGFVQNCNNPEHKEHEVIITSSSTGPLHVLPVMLSIFPEERRFVVVYLPTAPSIMQAAPDKFIMKRRLHEDVPTDLDPYMLAEYIINSFFGQAARYILMTEEEFIDIMTMTPLERLEHLVPNSSVVH